MSPSVSATLVSLFLQHSRQFPASGPLHFPQAIWEVPILQAGFMIFLILFCELRGMFWWNLLSDYIGLSWNVTLARTLQIDSLFEIRMNPVSTVLGFIRHAASWKCWPLYLGSLISIYSYDGTVGRVEAEIVRDRAACRRGTQWLWDFLESCSASNKCNLREWSDEEESESSV